MNRKKWFNSYEEACKHVEGLQKSGYKFTRHDKVPVIEEGMNGYGVHWYILSDGKFFHLTTKRKIFIHWQGRDITNAENKEKRPLF